MIPNPVRLWQEQGETTCTVCRLPGRCLYVLTPFGLQEVCFECFRALCGWHIRKVLEDYFSDPEMSPWNETERWYFNRSTLQGAYQDTLEAIRLRMYVKAAEARASGYASLEGAIRARCRPLRWVQGRDAWLDLIIRKVLPK